MARGKHLVAAKRERRWDIHIHSYHSEDSRSKIERILDVAKRKGLDGIAITDHGSLEGYFEAKRIAKKYGVGIVAGYEYRAAEGDVVVLGVEKMPPPHRLPAAKVVDFAHSFGGIAIAVHPFDPFRTGVGNIIRTVKFDAIETINSHCFIYGNAKAAKVASANSMPEVGGSDAHTASEVGNGFTVFSGDGSDGIIKAIKCGRTRAGGGINMPTFHKAFGTAILMMPLTLKKFLAGKKR